MSTMICPVRNLWSDHTVWLLLVTGLGMLITEPPGPLFLFIWVIVSSTEMTWRRLKAGRPSRPGHYVSHQDKVVGIWAVKIMSSPQGKRSRGDGLAQSGTSGVIGSKGLYWAESSVWMRSWAVGKTKWLHQKEILKESPKCWRKRHVFYSN